ncbi:MAG: AMP-binding protein, partial [Candidatus Omnitrophica bacterium]|nr:AMP-binding protein [Candidatus Omnitrophota bacterium]
RKIIFYFFFALCAVLRTFNLNLGKLFFRRMHRRFGNSLKFFVSGGAPLSPFLIWWFEVLGINILQGYGLTEASPVVSVNTPRENRLGSVGKPLPGVEVKIENNWEVGEILVRGENVMLGYYKSPEDTAEALKDHWLHTGDLGRIDSHGFLYVLGRKKNVMFGYYKSPEDTAEALKDHWLHTGDLGRIDSHGFLYVLGRKKNVIVLASGLKVYPEELEEELLKSPLVREACVIGKREPGFLDEKVYALIVPHEEYLGLNLEKNSQEIRELIKKEIRFLNERLASYKHIHNFELRKELPKTATRKIKKELVKKSLL